MQAPRRLMVVGIVVVVVVVLQLWWATKPVDAAALKGCGEACERDGSLANSHQSKHIHSSKSCQPTSYLTGKGHSCNHDYYADCCKAGERYPQYQCSPDVSDRTPANLTVNDFDKGGDGGGPSECDGKYHHNSEKVVALSTGWYNNGNRCEKKIRIFLDDKSVEAKVKDECDSFYGCDKDHGYQPPCDFDIVDASLAVWEALGISKDDPRYGFTQIEWTDA